MPDRLFDDFSPISTEQWMEKIRQDLKGKPPEKLNYTTPDGFALFPVARKDDLDALNVPQGPLPNAKTTADWQTHFTFSMEKAEEVIAILQNEHDFALDSVGFYLIRTDKYSPYAGYRPQAGIGAVNYQDILALTQAVSQPETAVHWEAGYASPAVFAAFTAALQHLDRDLTRQTGSIDNDLQYCADAEGDAFNLAVATAQYTAANMPAFHGLRLSLAWAENAGASPAEQIAWALSGLVDYVTTLSEKGLTAPEIIRQTLVEFGMGSDFYGEIAKIRAFRFLVPEIIRQVQGGDAQLQVRATGALANMSVLDPHVNMLRATTTAMAAVIGGYDLIDMPGFDAITTDGSRFSTRIARNIQHLLREESYLDRVADPAGGSWYIEQYAQKLAAKAWDIFQEIEQKGGFLSQLRSGELVAALVERRDKIANDYAKRKFVQVGANKYPLIGQELPEKQGRDLGPIAQKLKVDAGKSFQKMIQQVRQADAGYETIAEAISQENGAGKITLLQTILQKNEVIPAIAMGWADSNQLLWLPVFRPASIFESIYTVFSHNPAASVFLFPFGDIRMKMARLGFARDLFGTMGFEVKVPSRPDEATLIFEEAVATHPDYVVLCSDDEEYGKEGLIWMENMKGRLPGVKFVIAGKLDENESLQKAGVHHYIYSGMDVVDFAEGLKKELGR